MIRILIVALGVALSGCARDDGWNALVFGKIAANAPLADGGHHADAR